MNTKRLPHEPTPFGSSDPSQGYYVRHDSPTSVSVRSDRHEDTNQDCFIHDIESWYWDIDDDGNGRWSLSGRSWREGKAQPFDDGEVTK